MSAWLREAALVHGGQKELAATLSVSTRTLRTWKSGPAPERAPGRPRAALAEPDLVACIERAWQSLARGHDGWRSVLAVLAREGHMARTRLVQETVARLKRERAERVRKRVSERRESTRVLVKDALWCQDATHLVRDRQGEVEGILVRETFVPKTLAASVGGPASGEDVVAALEEAHAERGAWPLVLGMDNGGANRSEEVLALCARERIVILWNLPRTPQHNPRAERGIGDVKRASGLDAESLCGRDGRGRRRRRESALDASREELAQRLARARHVLDFETPRWRLGGWTPAELDSIAPRAEDLVSRERFYREVCCALEEVARNAPDARARRMQERETIWLALQRFGLVRRTRGGRLVPAPKAEGVS